MNPVILTVASTGGKWTRKDSSWIPMTPKEIVNDTIESFHSGASMAHIHARDENGRPTHNPEIFSRITDSIRQECEGIIIQISTGYMEGEVESKLEPLLKLRPDMASFNLKGSPNEILTAARLMDRYDVKPVVECFSVDMLNRSKKLIEDGVLRMPVFYEFVFGLEESELTFEDLAKDLFSRKSKLLPSSVWSQTRGGSHQKDLQALTILLGGHVRTGLEDNLYVREGVEAKRSAELVNQAADIVEVLGRKVARPDESRKILGLLSR